MVVSFRLRRRGRRIHPPPPPTPSASTRAADRSHPLAAASLDVPPPRPHPPCQATVSRLGTRIAALSEVPDINETVAIESDYEPSFALNLFPDGYSIGEPGKGMLLYLIGDDPKKRPYSRASRALLSDIEHGCLPQDILHGIPCKFRNGSTVCEVRDYRSVFSNGDDYSGDDLPKVKRVHLRLGTECVVKDLSSIADASWTYHDQLTAESIILSALQPRLNLDPTPWLEMLCDSSAKKFDLGLNKGRQNNSDTSVLIMSTNPPENCKPKEFNICEGATLCIENPAVEGILTCHVNNSKLAVQSDTNNTVQSSSILPNISALCDRMQCASDTAADHLFQSNEHQAQVETFQEHRESGQPQRVTVLTEKTKKPSNILLDKHESKKCSSPNKNRRLGFQNAKGLHKSISSANKEELDLGSEKRLQVEAKINQTICKKDMEVPKQVPLPLPLRDPCTSLNKTNPGIEKIPEAVHIRLKECHVAPILDPNNYDMVGVSDQGTPFVVPFSGGSREAGEHLEDMAATKSQVTASKRKASKVSIISLNQDINLKGKRQENVDTQIKPPCTNRSFEELGVTGGVRSQLDIDLELEKRRQEIKDTSLLYISGDAPESCKPNEFIVCKDAAVCIENAALEGMPSVTFNSSHLYYPCSIHVNNARSIVESDYCSTIRSSSTLTNSSALCDRKQGGSITPAPDHLLQSNEEGEQVTVLQLDHDNGQTQRVTVVPQKRKKSLKLLNERHESKNHSPPNKSARLRSQNSKGQNSTGSSNTEGFHLRSPKGLQVEVKKGQIIGNNEIKVQKKVPLFVHSSCHPQAKSLHIRFSEGDMAPTVDLKNSDMADPRGSRTPSVTSFSANSSKAACEPDKDKAATEPQLMALNRNVAGISSISLNQEIDLNEEGQQKFDIHVEPPCENRSLEPAITGGVNSKFGISTRLRACTGQPINNSEPDIEKILSEVILATQRHGLNEKAAKSDVLETSRLLPPCEFFQSENVEEIPFMRDETTISSVSDGATRTWKIRRLTFYPSEYPSCNGLVDESKYTLCLLEPEALDHQITVGAIYGDEHIHIATLPTSCHAEKFVDQFISLMKRDGYNLCDDIFCNESSELRQQSEDVSHLGYPTGKDAEYLMFSPSAVNSLHISTNNEVGCTFQNKLPDFHANFWQPLTQQWALTKQPLTLETPEVFFLNPSHVAGRQHYTGQFVQDQGSSFACDAFAMDLHQFQSVQPSQEVSVDQYLQCRDDILGFSDIYSASGYRQLCQEASMDQLLQYGHDLAIFNDTNGVSTTARRYSQWEASMDQYLQYRHDIPWFSDAYRSSMRTSSYGGQWRQVYTQMGSVVYQWDLPAFCSQIHENSRLHGIGGWSIPLSELQPIRHPQMSSRSVDFDGRVTSTLVQIPMPLDYQFPSQGMC